MAELKAEVNLLEDAIYIVKDGHLTKIKAREHGEDMIIWKNGKVLDVIRSGRIRINGQKVIE